MSQFRSTRLPQRRRLVTVSALIRYRVSGPDARSPQPNDGNALTQAEARRPRDLPEIGNGYPHTTVQCLGWLDGEILGTQLPSAVPKYVTNAIGARAIGFFVTTEDGSSPANRIISGGGDGGVPVADYSLDRLPPAQAEHTGAIGDFTRRLLHAGLAGVDRYLGLAGSSHALGLHGDRHRPAHERGRPKRQGPRHGRPIRPPADFSSAGRQRVVSGHHTEEDPFEVFLQGHG